MGKDELTDDCNHCSSDLDLRSDGELLDALTKRFEHCAFVGLRLRCDSAQRDEITQVIVGNGFTVGGLMLGMAAKLTRVRPTKETG